MTRRRDDRLGLSQKAKSAISALIKASDDAGLKSWIIEYGEGDNPSEWLLYSQGGSSFGKKDTDGKIIVPAENDIISSVFFTDITWLVGKK